MFHDTLTDDDGERVAEYLYDLFNTASRRSQYKHICPDRKTGVLRVPNVGEPLASARLSGGENTFVYPREYHWFVLGATGLTVCSGRRSGAVRDVRRHRPQFGGKIGAGEGDFAGMVRCTPLYDEA